MSKKEQCDICGGEAVFESKTYQQSEGNECGICGKWICDEYTDYKHSGTIFNGTPVDFVCKDCVQRNVD